MSRSLRGIGFDDKSDVFVAACIFLARSFGDHDHTTQDHMRATDSWGKQIDSNETTPGGCLMTDAKRSRELALEREKPLGMRIAT